ncbi:spore coat protein [Metabacillus fastidiosus]|uniref:Spore coat protein n=1 Tax=Metabacillus fastidiosus TaxID=1458 RepID=A0ABU6P2T5_9BACI|nr:spore coat protein [Metabacillus fastidiosus]MED4403233.1 spore coat protein [Metabacillus fastidiosus]MED4455468.1 spore coat protein [Metabacillus fastidiosus]MED4461657.1 spore coat protein [Metabacillus fastidiosus]
MKHLNTPAEIEQDFISSILYVEGYITAKTIQTSGDIIYIKNSHDVKIITFNTQQAASLHASLQAMITLFLGMIIVDSKHAEMLNEEIVNKFTVKQTDRKEIFVENCYRVTIDLRNNEMMHTLQFLIEILFALISELVL